MVLCTLGDAVLDVVVRLGRGLVAGDDVPAGTNLAAGGQAANVAAWAAALGATARYVGRRGDDFAGRLLEAELAERGVDLAGPVGGRTGVVVSLIGADSDRSMASDRGSATELAAADLEADWLRDCDRLHVSGYVLAADPGAGAAAEAARLARAAGARVSLDLSSSTLIEATGADAFRARVEAVTPELVFATEDEAEALAGAGAWVTVLKQGAAGCTVIRDGESERFAAAPATPVDATGAGDAFAAGYLVGGPELALEAGARCVSSVGAMP
ncbi:MAG: carbohydrate kinase family protein [Thermoleophilaceae bacterium]